MFALLLLLIITNFLKMKEYILNFVSIHSKCIFLFLVVVKFMHYPLVFEKSGTRLNYIIKGFGRSI